MRRATVRGEKGLKLEERGEKGLADGKFRNISRMPFWSAE